MAGRRIAVITAGLSTPSSTRMLGDRLAHAALAELRERGIDATSDVFELRDYAHELTDNLLTGFAPPALEQMINTVVSADGIIAVTPIFSTSYSGLFKSFIDVLDPQALNGTPVLIGANAGTARHSLAIDYAIRRCSRTCTRIPCRPGCSQHPVTGDPTPTRWPRSVRGSTAVPASWRMPSPRGSPCATPTPSTLVLLGEGPVVRPSAGRSVGE